jgi:hypothetical protein
MGAERVISFISTYQRRLTSVLLIPGTSYGRRHRAPNDFANKLFVAFRFGNTEVGFHFSRMFGFFQAAFCAVSADLKCPCASTLIAINVYDRMGPTYITSAIAFLRRFADAKTWSS